MRRPPAICGNDGEVLPVMADVSDHHAVRDMVEQTVKTFDAIDIVVSNVGIRKYRAFLKSSPEDWDELLKSNLSPEFYLSRYAIPHMREKKSRPYHRHFRRRRVLGAHDAPRAEHSGEDRHAWPRQGHRARVRR
jgi:NAD(P)-dependent dehydrogenase (short-subunit alcohol dehydrogenase family)